MKKAVKQIKAGYYLYWNERTFIVNSVSWTERSIELQDLDTSVVTTVWLEDLFGKGETPIFAPSKVALQIELKRRPPPPTFSSDVGQPTWALERADEIVELVRQVDSELLRLKSCCELTGQKFSQTETLIKILSQLTSPKSMKTYYNYRKVFIKHGGSRAAIAASLHRSTLNSPCFDHNTLHFVHRCILRFRRMYNAKQLFEFMEKLWKRLDGYWVDLNKVEGDTPEILIELLFDRNQNIDAIRANPDFRAVLTPIELPKRSWFYEHLVWFNSTPDMGKAHITELYGEDTWSREYCVFDTFVHIAQMPLEYTVCDHYLLDVFVLDEDTRSQISRLWLTVVIDAFSRCAIGYRLLYEMPCIESVLGVLEHAVYPKQYLSGAPYDIFGIPQTVALDNAWAHSSDSLHSAARILALLGFESIDFQLRNAYQARKGALIERFFGNVAGKIKSALKDAIHSSDPKVVRNAAATAWLIFQDVEEFIDKMIESYHKTPHTELGGMTPLEKWQEGLTTWIPLPPDDTLEVRRAFWRQEPETRVITSSGINFKGITYWSDALARLPRKSLHGSNIEYSIRFHPSDMSKIAVFNNGVYKCDAFAQQFRLADNTYLPVSLWEMEIAKTLAKDAKTPDMWLEFVQIFDKRRSPRLKEKKKAHKGSDKSPQPLKPKKSVKEQVQIAQRHVETTDYDDAITEYDQIFKRGEQ